MINKKIMLGVMALITMQQVKASTPSPSNIAQALIVHTLFDAILYKATRFVDVATAKSLSTQQKTQRNTQIAQGIGSRLAQTITQDKTFVALSTSQKSALVNSLQSSSISTAIGNAITALAPALSITPTMPATEIQNIVNATVKALQALV